MISMRKETFYKWSTLIGVFLVLSPLGLSFFWGNMYVYVASYIVDHLHAESGVQAPWIVTLKCCCTSFSAVSAGFFTKRVGERVVVFIGIFLTCSSYFLAYITIQKSNLLFNLTFGILYGLGDGFVVVTAIEYVLEWADKKSGLCIAACRTGPYLGAIIANQFVSSYINPDNLEPDRIIGPATFFSNKEILENVPNAFLYLGSMFLAFQMLGLILLRKNTATPKHGYIDGVSYGSLKKDSEIRETSNTGNDIPSGPMPNASLQAHEEKALTTMQMVRTSQFYTLFFTFLMSNISLLIVTNYYKSFGQIWIHDDHFLTTLGSMVPVVTAFTSVVWGIFSDRFGVKSCLVLFSASMAVLSAFYYLTPEANVWVFCVTTLILSGIVASKFTIYNISTVKIFGRKHQLTNYGVMNLASLGLLFAPPIIEAVLLHLGWFYVFCMSSVLNLVALVWFIFSLEASY